MLILNILTPIAFAFLNRARGSRLYDKVNSTEIGRIVSMLGMALVTSLFFFPDYIKMSEVLGWSFCTLLLWCTPAWDKKWSATIGHESISRLLGLFQLTVRMLLILPYFFGLAYLSGNYIYIIGALTLGIPYYIWGYISKSEPIFYSELSVGALIGVITTLILG